MKKIFVALLLALLVAPVADAAKKKAEEPQEEEETQLNAGTLSGLALRNIGPAINSGRISDFAVTPGKRHRYFAATASGGLWKTDNAGTTWVPIFDGEGSYSIGTVTMDPANPNVIWVGTGENNGQRSVSFGDGVYKSLDGGQSWTHVGLKEAEHIGINGILHQTLELHSYQLRVDDIEIVKDFEADLPKTMVSEQHCCRRFRHYYHVANRLPNHED